jgi:hypothetical protein
VFSPGFLWNWTDSCNVDARSSRQGVFVGFHNTVSTIPNEDGDRLKWSGGNRERQGSAFPTTYVLHDGFWVLYESGEFKLSLFVDSKENFSIGCPNSLQVSQQPLQ